MFAEAVTEVCEVALGRVRMRLRKEPGIAARAAELASRETGCCSFFTFTLIATSGGLMLEVSVAPQRAQVVTALARRAADVAGVAVTEVGG
ncbi:hypothetical protein [Actinomadura harenae]|uniref:hypothetical protein n=1 Tax=Actinomadura harenae TaxID=2483351 RepID=UPI001F3BB178|nr:hypothetical protein [Actinomadura harenae]